MLVNTFLRIMIQDSVNPSHRPAGESVIRLVTTVHSSLWLISTPWVGLSLAAGIQTEHPDLHLHSALLLVKITLTVTPQRLIIGNTNKPTFIFCDQYLIGFCVQETDSAYE